MEVKEKKNVETCVAQGIQEGRAVLLCFLQKTSEENKFS